MPEVASIQTYSGTAKPFDFNGLVRHSYLRQNASEGELITGYSSRIKLSISVIVPDFLNISVKSLANLRRVALTLAMAICSFNVTTIRLKNALEPSHVYLKVPLSRRSQLSYLTQLPVPSQHGGMIPISELGSFVYKKQDDLIFHKDLVDVEYVLGEPIGRLSAPIYAMFGVDDLLLDYQTVNGKQLQGEYLGPPEDQTVPGFEWSGEWTVTYETFRDMGTAFAVALVVIYMLVVWQFGNFIIPANTHLVVACHSQFGNFIIPAVIMAPDLPKPVIHLLSYPDQGKTTHFLTQI
jgi:multidrug efflux pump subunit AcrB